MIELLKILLKNNIFPQSTIFNGTDYEIPLYVIKFLLCENSYKPCDTCISCKKVKKNVHPDLLIIQVEENSKNIKINQIREAKEFCSMTTSGKCKIVYIINAELMSIEAQNSLLKILEEPGKNNYFILQSSNKYKLLPTILSRCIHFNLRPTKNVEPFEEFKLKNLKKLSFFELHNKLSELMIQHKNINEFLKILIISNYPYEFDFLNFLLDLEDIVKYNINKDSIVGIIAFYIKGGKNCLKRFVI